MNYIDKFYTKDTNSCFFEDGKIHITNPSRTMAKAVVDIRELDITGDSHVFETKFVILSDNQCKAPIVSFALNCCENDTNACYSIDYKCTRGFEWQINKHEADGKTSLKTSRHYLLELGKVYTAVFSIKNDGVGVEIKFYLLDENEPESFKIPFVGIIDVDNIPQLNCLSYSVSLGSCGDVENASDVLFFDCIAHKVSQLNVVLLEHEKNIKKEYLSLPKKSVNSLSLPKFFSSKMVIQQNMPISIWGKTKNGDMVTVEFANQKVSVTAENERFLATLKPMTAGGAYDMKISTSDEEIVYNDVMVGEVWFCTGQSNMSWAVKDCAGAEDANSLAVNPMLRLFNGNVSTHLTEQFDIISGNWEYSSPESRADFSSIGYHFGKELQESLGVCVGVIHSSTGGTEIRTWMSPKSASLSKWTSPGRSSALYNGAIAPYAGFGINGFVWFQGESNVAETDYNQYIDDQKLLIEGYREAWKNDSLPFYYVQLAAHTGDTPIMKTAMFREAQGITQKTVPNTFMALSLDLGEEFNIHFVEKRPLAHRLAEAAKALSYNIDVVYKYPEFKEMVIEGEKAVLNFDNVGSGLVVKGDKIDGFVVAGEKVDDVLQFVDAEATLTEDNKIIVCAEGIDEILSVRYAFENYPKFSVYNKEGFPMAPFRTDREFKVKNRNGSFIPQFPLL